MDGKIRRNKKRILSMALNAFKQCGRAAVVRKFRSARDGRMVTWIFDLDVWRDKDNRLVGSFLCHDAWGGFQFTESWYEDDSIMDQFKPFKPRKTSPRSVR